MPAAKPSGPVRVKAAATAIVVDDRPDLHVLLLRRRAASDFVGGMIQEMQAGVRSCARDAEA